jgi:NADH:ubiquinone oxidoreductase subunit F (NADH-binding)
VSEGGGRAELLRVVQDSGGLRPGVATEVGRRLGVPEAEVHGAASFYHLLARPDVELRVCQGLSCKLRGAEAALAAALEAGVKAEGCSCLAACDRPPAVLAGRETRGEVPVEVIAQGRAAVEALPELVGHVGPGGGVYDLDAAPRYDGAGLDAALRLGPEALIAELKAAGLQGRGGAGFPAHFKWTAVRAQADATRYVVLNADEGEPGTFKDRELMRRRPDLVLEGLIIAARAVGAGVIYAYLRGEFSAPWRALESAIDAFGRAGRLEGLEVHLHAGHGAYICGEETALLEALEGRRGMPRLKPPFPTEHGLWGRPTLIHNVETIAAVPSIAQRGGAWFAGLGATQPGRKLYCISGDVVAPGVYELPLGVSLDTLVEAAGGYVGTLAAFSPGGASSGFLPPSESGRPLDFKALGEVGSMLGSAGVVVLNETRDLRAAARQQLRFFEVESCGQCAPCRIGTRFLREAIDRDELALAEEVAWEMGEGSICGLGQIAALPLTSAMKYFPESFR